MGGGEGDLCMKSGDRKCRRTAILLSLADQCLLCIGDRQQRGFFLAATTLAGVQGLSITDWLDRQQPL